MDALAMKYDKSPIFGDIYNLNNLKSLLNDLLNEYLVKNGYKRNYWYLDLRNTIGIISLLIACVVVGLSYLYKFNEAKEYLGLCIVIYYTLYLLNLIVVYFDSGKFYYKDFYIVTRADTTPVYVILIYKKNEFVPKKYTKSILELFYENGRLDHELFLKDIDKLMS